MNKTTSGFTIVELLIVIVVIAILAAITIVSYNGIQTRAYNSKMFSVANQYYKALASYSTVSGSYPASNSCLGKGYPNNACWATNADGTSPVMSVNATVDSNLTEFVPSKPDITPQLINVVVVNQFRGGVWYIASGTVYATTAPLVAYYVKGNNAECGMKVSQQVNEGPLTQCIVALPS